MIKDSSQKELGSLKLLSVYSFIGTGHQQVDLLKAPRSIDISPEIRYSKAFFYNLEKP